MGLVLGLALPPNRGPWQPPRLRSLIPSPLLRGLSCALVLLPSRGLSAAVAGDGACKASSGKPHLFYTLSFLA